MQIEVKRFFSLKSPIHLTVSAIGSWQPRRVSNPLSRLGKESWEKMLWKAFFLMIVVHTQLLFEYFCKYFISWGTFPRAVKQFLALCWILFQAVLFDMGWNIFHPWGICAYHCILKIDLWLTFILCFCVALTTKAPAISIYLYTFCSKM